MLITTERDGYFGLRAKPALGASWLIILFRSSYRLHLSEHVAELAVVLFNTVVEVQGDALVGGVFEFLIERLQFRMLLDELVSLLFQFLTLRCGSGGADVGGQLFDVGRVAALEQDDVLGTHPGERAFVVAAQVNKALEGPLFAAGEQPVDWPSLVRRQVVLVEPGGKVAANRVPWLLVASRPETVSDELQVHFE